MDETQITALFTGWIAIVIWLLVILILILWVLLPFAVFGLKGRIDQLIKEQKDTNELLIRILKTQQPKGEKEKKQKEHEEIKIDFDDT